ncbi:hypothetical protein J1614_005363 [Plenodomus biglobosus]|nr:hypothetical protein J1614_005363 [Plenodomus biglobosus]
MRSVVATQSGRSAAKQPAGVTKHTQKDQHRPVRALRKHHEYFWYTSTDGVDCLATSSSTLSEVPRYVNDHTLDPSLFENHPYPTTFPPGGSWPPQTAQDVLHSIGYEFNDCVGDRCYTNDVCEEAYCDHTFENWRKVTQDWQDHFELQQTEDRGIGVYTKRSFKKDEVLGWYAGEIIPGDSSHPSNAYLMEVPIGKSQEDLEQEDSGSDSGYGSSSSESSEASSARPVEETVMIDGKKQGNWTRFINHSCLPHCHFRLRRVGMMRIMTVEAIRNIPAGVELTVSYGSSYYGPESRKICYCGAKRCVSRARKAKEEEPLRSRKKPRVKKCRRVAPP